MNGDAEAKFGFEDVWRPNRPPHGTTRHSPAKRTLEFSRDECKKMDMDCGTSPVVSEAKVPRNAHALVDVSR